MMAKDPTRLTKELVPELHIRVYVDDMLLPGTADMRDRFWDRLRNPKVGYIRLDDPEKLDRLSIN